MQDLFESAAPPDGGGSNLREYTVSEISGRVKRIVEDEFPHVRVRGEVGRVSRPRSGHVYLDLKDEGAVLSGIVWRNAAAGLAVQPEEGMEVVVSGRLTTYAGQSRYQIVIESLEPAGEGALMAMLEKRRKALAAEGLFDAGRKKPLPYLPEVVGVVTSPSGAVVRDILHRLRDRFPRRVLVWPAAVQGDSCAREVARGIEGFNALAPGGDPPRPDLIIVARGGGSIEDLWGFNEELVVRAAAASDIPLISAVGHETDTTLIDHAADHRAPTPTAAAEAAVPVRSELLADLQGAAARLANAHVRSLDGRRQRLRDLARALPRATSLLEAPRQRLDMWSERLPRTLARAVQRRRLRLSEAAGALRPGAAKGTLAAARSRLDGLAVRLSPEALRRDASRKSRDLAALWTQSERTVRGNLGRLRERLDALERVRTTVGYRETLRRGYAVVRADGDVVSGTAAAARADGLEIEFADGRLEVSAKPGKAGRGA